MVCSFGVRSNEVPVVDAGEDQVTIFPAPAVLSGSADDFDFGPEALIVQWTLVSGPGNVTFSDQDELGTTATFDRTGVYVLQLRAFDGQDATIDMLTVEVGPREVRVHLAHARFVARTDGRPANKISFVMYGFNSGEQKLDLKPGDILFARVGGSDFFDGVLVGEPGGPPLMDFFSMGFRGAIHTSNARGELFDASNSSFRSARMRYNPKNQGTLVCTVSGGAFDIADLLPVVPAPGATVTANFPVVVGVFRRQDDKNLQIAYQSMANVTVRASTNAVSGK